MHNNWTYYKQSHCHIPGEVTHTDEILEWYQRNSGETTEICFGCSVSANQQGVAVGISICQEGPAKRSIGIYINKDMPGVDRISTTLAETCAALASLQFLSKCDCERVILISKLTPFVNLANLVNKPKTYFTKQLREQTLGSRLTVSARLLGSSPIESRCARLSASIAKGIRRLNK